MEKVILAEKGIEFIARYAAPSLQTGNFVAGIVGSDVETVSEAFSYPGEIRVHDQQGLHRDKTYTGYGDVETVEQIGDEILVKVRKAAGA